MVGIITYNASTNTIMAVGGSSAVPVGFVDLWSADKAGTLSLQARTGIAAVDGSGLALTYNARPADRVVLGGAKQDLYVTVTNWASMTSATVRLIGTDTNDAAQTEDLAITGDGTYYATKYFKTLTQTQVTVFSGSGSFDYEVVQAQWGVIWKLGEYQFKIGCYIVVGDGTTASFFAESGKELVFEFDIATGGYIIGPTANAEIRFGELIDADKKTTRSGCSLQFRFYTYARFEARYFYSCRFNSLGTVLLRIDGYGRVWNCLLNDNVGFSEPRSWGPCDFSNVIFAGLNAQITPFSGYVYNNAFFSATGWAIITRWAETEDITLKNLYLRGVTNLFYFLAVSSPIKAYLINVDSDNWGIYWDGTEGTLYRQYEFDLTVTDKDNTPLENAAVTLKDKEGNTVFSTTTDASGAIATQTVSRGYYQQPTGNTLQDYSPHTLTVEKGGYQTYVKTFILSEKTMWEIKLAKATPILLDAGKPVVNLNTSNPENKHVLSL